MIKNMEKKSLGSRNEREIKKLRPMVARINELEAELQKVPDDALRQKTADWKARLAKIEDKAELTDALNEIMPDAFAPLKNACRRLYGQPITGRPHPLQPHPLPPYIH